MSTCAQSRLKGIFQPPSAPSAHSASPFPLLPLALPLPHPAPDPTPAADPCPCPCPWSETETRKYMARRQHANELKKSISQPWHAGALGVRRIGGGKTCLTTEKLVQNKLQPCTREPPNQKNVCNPKQGREWQRQRERESAAGIACADMRWLWYSFPTPVVRRYLAAPHCGIGRTVLILALATRPAGHHNSS